jgi:DNA-binding CsgD family transcriptional regulator
MSHLIILTLVLNLVAGTAVSLYTLASYRRYRRPFLKTLLAYVLSFNGLVIVYLSYSYVLTNVFRNDMSKVLEYPAVFALLLFLVFCAEFGMTVNVFRLVRHLKGREMSGAAKGLFALWAASFAAASAWGLLRFYQDPQTQTFYRVHAAWMASVILVILAVLVTGLAGPGGRGQDSNSLRPFAWIFLAAYGAFAFSSLDFYLLHTGLQKFYDPVVLFGINLCPLLWLKVFFEKASPAPATAEFDAAKLGRFCEKHGISKRERDIIEQVMNGSSNRDIEKALFISGNTVKNHLYNVFQKAGVKSRSQLTHRVLHFEG